MKLSDARVGMPVLVTIHRGRYWHGVVKRRVVKVTVKRIGIEYRGAIRYYNPANVRLDENRRNHEQVES